MWGVLKTGRPTSRHLVRPCFVLHVLFVTVAACSVFLGNETGFKAGSDGRGSATVDWETTTPKMNNESGVFVIVHLLLSAF